MGGERGQASIEWVALVLLAGCAFGALLAFVPVMDGRPLGAALARALVCAVKRDCGDEHAVLARAYGESGAALVRSSAPNIVYEGGMLTLPVDYRRCRSHRCSDAPNDRDLDASHATHGGAPATAFTHVLQRGGRTYIQYWFYYPDSPTTFAHSNGILRRANAALGLLNHLGPLDPVPIHRVRDPAFHLDDWEGYQLRIDPDGTRWARATKHGGYAWCKSWFGCAGWGPATGWTRVSRGSHAGHIPLKGISRIRRGHARSHYKAAWPGNGLHERSTSASNLRLVPLETLDRRSYRPRARGITPPWQKGVYTDPEANGS